MFARQRLAALALLAAGGVYLSLRLPGREKERE